MAILNHRDYRLAKARMLRLEKAIGAAISIGQLATNLSDEAIIARKSALQGEYEKVQADVAAYERLQSSEPAHLEEVGTVELGLLPILGRIKRRLSQRQFADVLGIREQQVQRYESERYAGISLKRFEEILRLLGIEINPHFEGRLRTDRPRAQLDALLMPTSKIVKEVRKRQWVPETIDSDWTEEINAYLNKGIQLIGQNPSFRRSLTDDRDFDPTALMTWLARVACEAQRSRSKLKTKFDFSDMRWLPQLVRLSRFDDGPLRAIDFLAEKGIALIIEGHFDNTYVDGAAFLLPDRTPVISLTLRHNRIDNFWFTLLHEIAHIFLHYNKGLDRGFVDDLDVGGQSQIEQEADSFARSALIPDKIWNTAPARFSKSADLIVSFAEAWGIHPAIVAGRVQYERRDFKLFRNLLGQGRVRKLLFSER